MNTYHNFHSSLVSLKPHDAKFSIKIMDNEVFSTEEHFTRLGFKKPVDTIGRGFISSCFFPAIYLSATQQGVLHEKTR